jgi:hypothetical protein
MMRSDTQSDRELQALCLFSAATSRRILILFWPTVLVLVSLSWWVN